MAKAKKLKRVPANSKSIPRFQNEHGSCCQEDRDSSVY
jgi:hypothetical protein